MSDKPTPAAEPAVTEAEPGWVYMLRCQNGSLYTGWTNDLAARIAAHRAGRGAKYTRAFGVRELAYAEQLADKSQALRREAAIKRLPRARKEALSLAWRQAGCPGAPEGESPAATGTQK